MERNTVHSILNKNIVTGGILHFTYSICVYLNKMKLFDFLKILISAITYM